MKLLLVAALAIAGCKKSSSDQPADDFATQARRTLKGFADRACACDAKPCVDKVLAEMDEWGRANKPKLRDAPPDLVAFDNRIGTCASQVLANQTARSAMAGDTKVDANKPRDRPLPASKPEATVDQLLADVRPLLASDYGAVINHIEAKYVRRDGTLDPKYGHLALRLTVASELADDPSRPIGAPVPTGRAESASCPALGFTGGKWVRGPHSTCREGEAVTTRCTLAQLWDKAIAEAKAPPAALAVIERYRSPDIWVFSIKDAPRKIDIRLNIPDDCTPPK